MRTTTRLTAIGVVSLMLVITAAPVRTDDPVSSSVRFNREIIRIFDRKCLSCHAPGGIAMSLATYRDARPWARAIREEIVEQRMPPWSAARGYARFQDDIGLTPRELSTILTWADGGVPRGDESDLPMPAHGTAVRTPDEPDHRVAIPTQSLPGDAEDVVRRVTVDIGLTSDRWVRKVEVRPGDRGVLRAAFVSVIQAGQPPVWAGAWTPWKSALAPAVPGAFLVRAGSRLAVELHYRGREAPAADDSSVALFFAPKGDWRAMTSLTIETAPVARGAAASHERGESTLPRDVVVWGLKPDLAVDGQSFEVTARKPGGVVEVLLWIPKAHAAWPAAYIFNEPVRLPAGTVVSVTAAGAPGPLRARATLTLHEAEPTVLRR